MLKKLKGIFYGWWIVAASFILFIITGGTALYGFTAFFEPISREMKWSSAATSFAFSLRSIEGGLLQPFIGFFVEHVGIRKCIFAGIALMGLSLFLISQLSTLLSFYIGFIILSIGFTMAAGIPQYTAVSNWFHRRRSFALGLLSTGFGVSGIITPIIAIMIDSFGWRETMLILCPFVLLIGLPLSFVIRDRPEKYGMLPEGFLPVGNVQRDPNAESSKPGHEAEEYAKRGLTVRECLATKTFWLLFLFAFLTQFAVSVIPVQEMAHLVHSGISAKLAALTMTGITMVSLVGRLGFSWLGDMYSKKLLLAIAAAMQAFGFLIYANITSAWMIIPFLVFYAIGFGAAIPLLPAIRVDYFGTRCFASISGLMAIGYAIAGVIAPVFSGWMFDMRHTYTTAFTIYAALSALAIPITVLLPGHKFNVHRSSFLQR
jgi:MFS family permease